MTTTKAEQLAARTSPVHQPAHGWTDADADASRPALELENERLRRNIKNAINHIVCIGGPLNDNKLGYSKQQMVTFWRIKEELEA